MKDIGFTLKCNKCGNKIEIKSKNFYNEQFEYKPCIILELAWDFEEGYINCKCGNKIII